MLCFNTLVLLFSVFLIATCGDSNWKGRWFPENPHTKQNPMGVSNVKCDDAIHNLDTDYDGNSMNYTCFDDKKLYYANPTVHPILEQEHIPKGFRAMHYCMNQEIHYNHKIPTFGSHRPLWAKYGEYAFLPKQRWLHNLEHGAVVMLYHPCADSDEVKLLKKILKNCLYRYVISANSDLTPTRPLCLITWGYRISFSKIDMELVVHFIKHHANKAPETITKDGQYGLLLLEKARVLSENDTQICPSYNM